MLYLTDRDLLITTFTKNVHMQKLNLAIYIEGWECLQYSTLYILEYNI